MQGKKADYQNECFTWNKAAGGIQRPCFVSRGTCYWIGYVDLTDQPAKEPGVTHATTEG
jgi:hypothetical protein